MASRTAISRERDCAAAQQQVRHIGAGDDQHQAGHAQQHCGEISVEWILRHACLNFRADQCAMVAIGFRIRRRQILGDGSHLGLRLRQTDARFQPALHGEDPVVAAVSGFEVTSGEMRGSIIAGR